MQDLATIRLENDVLHIERAGTKSNGPQESLYARAHCVAAPVTGKIFLAAWLACAVTIECLLLPERIQIQHHHEYRRTLHSLN